jgi:hypothetical protein
MKVKVSVCACFLLFLTHTPIFGAPLLVEWAFNDNGSVYSQWDTASDALPDHFDTGSFNWDSGLGDLTISFEGAGDYAFIAYFDHEVVEATNTFFDEYGDAHGSQGNGQSWEIDEPFFGDIYDNVLNGQLDNTNGVPQGWEEDVSIAMGWEFSLLDGESALLSIILSDTVFTSDFYLSHNDPLESFFIGSSLEIHDAAAPVPEPGTIILMACGLLGMALFRRKARL